MNQVLYANRSPSMPSLWVPIMPASGLVDRVKTISLLGNTRQLLAKRFILRESGSERAWKVAQCEYMVDNASYDVAFEDTTTIAIQLGEEQLVDLIMQSQLVN